MSELVNNIYNKKNSKKNKINVPINTIIEKKIQLLNNNDINNDTNSDDDIELEKLEKELIFKSKSNYHGQIQPKNYGNMWTDDERNKIIKYLKKNIFCVDTGIFDEKNIIEIAKKLERSEFGVKEEIKKMIFCDFIGGLSHKNISLKFNIPVQNVKLLLKQHMDKNGKKIINSMECENKLLKLQIENIKLKLELEQMSQSL